MNNLSGKNFFKLTKENNDSKGFFKSVKNLGIFFSLIKTSTVLDHQILSSALQQEAVI